MDQDRVHAHRGLLLRHGYAVNDRAGWLDGDYAAVNGRALNTAGIQKFLEYLRTHAGVREIPYDKRPAA